ncbi:MAG: hypothetical protein HGA96_14435 [Desulfobulbaceae bacterium]|nr:hypothetical protein [Desulfobulbaceae bacterium]
MDTQTYQSWSAVGRGVFLCMRSGLKRLEKSGECVALVLVVSLALTKVWKWLIQQRQG